MTLDSEGFKTVEISNKNSDFLGVQNDHEFEDNIEFLNSLRANKFVLEKSYDYNISSFNFSRQAFYDKVWNEQTIKARGLFLNTQTKEIVIRSYDKFFNIHERPETSLNTLQKNLQFPIQIWLKENGYLSLVGYNSQFDSLVFASKSSTNSDFAGWLENLFYQKIDQSKLLEIKEFLKKSKSSLVFEVLEPVSDPHIIEYIQPELVLLDIISREIQFRAENTETRQLFAKKYNLTTKQKALEIGSFEEFVNWYNQTQSMNFQFENKHVEGFVIEDDSVFKFKIKLPYYSFWKQMRSMQENLIKNKLVNDFDRYIDPIFS